MHIDVTIGWTKSNPATGYSSYDGYQAGAEQHTETITVEWTNSPLSGGDPDPVLLKLSGKTPDEIRADRVQRTVEALAEHVFSALNDPFAGMAEGLTGQIAHLVAATGYRGLEAGHYSLSVGDTVTVGEVTLACARTGWERVRLAPATA